jgi:hypothetical protein
VPESTCPGVTRLVHEEEVSPVLNARHPAGRMVTQHRLSPPVTSGLRGVNLWPGSPGCVLSQASRQQMLAPPPQVKRGDANHARASLLRGKLLVLQTLLLSL